MRNGRDAEKRAEKILRKNGYKILSYQERRKYHLKVDDSIEEVVVIVDYIVKKGRKIYVVEVKTGKDARFPRNTGTRRQLLEYYLVFKVDGVLLLDMGDERIKEIEFSFVRKKILFPFAYLLFGFLLGGAFIYFIMRGK